MRRWRKSRRRNKGCERVECIYVVPPFPPPPRHPQAEEKLSAGFEFEKQMKKFNDVELRCRRHYPRAWRGHPRMDSAGIKLLLNPKVGGISRYFVCYSYLRRARPANICGHESPLTWGNSNCRRNFHPRRSLTLNFAQRRRFRDHAPASSITRHFGTFANAIWLSRLMHAKSVKKKTTLS